MNLRALIALGLGLVAAWPASAAAESGYKIAVCDWMILKRQKLNAFPLAREIGADGVEVDMGPLGERPTFESKLGDPAVREQFLAKAREVNIEICSIAMSGFYAQSFADREGVERMVQDAVDTARAMGTTVIYLPLGVKGDLVKRPELRPVIVDRLKAAGKQAEAAGVVIGIETALDAAGEVALLADIGSPAVKSYFNFANPIRAGRDLCEELRILGKDRIVQIHASNTDGVWLENDPTVNLPKIKATLDDLGWRGWLVIERSREAKRTGKDDVTYNYGGNAAYLKQVFQATDVAP